MEVAVLNKQRKYPVDREQIISWVTEILSLQKKPAEEISIVLVNNARMRITNREFRNIDRTTDVLSFPMLEGVGGDLHPGFLGDIMISLEKTEADAKDMQRTMDEQLLILLIHGVLHLLGYDHEISEAEEIRMQTQERFILEKITG